MMEEEGLEKTVKPAFISGFPDKKSMELQQVKDIDSEDVRELIARARIITLSAPSGLLLLLTCRVQSLLGLAKIF